MNQRRKSFAEKKNGVLPKKAMKSKILEQKNCPPSQK